MDAMEREALNRDAAERMLNWGRWFAIVTTVYTGSYIYENSSLKFMSQAEGYIEPDGGGSYNYVYQYKDYLGNVRLSYTDSNEDGIVDVNEIVEESNYYPFGLKHRGYNGGVNGMPNKFLTYNDVEFEESLGLNMHEMDMRHYDPAIARWVVQDPVVHFNYSPYQAFDNNPVYWSDPSGADATSLINDIWNASGSGKTKWKNNNDGTFSGSNGKSVDCDKCPKEGETKDEYKDGKGGYRVTKKYYHSGGLGEEGWYSEGEYLELFRTTIRAIGQGQASIESLHNYNFTEDMLLVMVAWAVQAYEQYGGEPRLANGAITPLYFTSPFFAPGIGLKFAQMSNTSKFAFWSGKGTQQAAIDAGYIVLGQTRAGRNLAALTADMAYAPGTQAYNFWGRLSAALAGKVPKGGTANVFLTREAVNNTNSIWNVFEKPVLLQNKVKIKYNWVD